MPFDAPEVFAQALAHYNAGRLHEAGASCRQALLLDPRCAAAWNLLGIVAYSARQFEASLSCFASALGVSPRVAEFHSNRGMALQAMGRYADALLSFHQSIELHPASAAAHDNLGSCLHALGRSDEAVASHRRALALDPAFAAAHNNLGNSHLARGNVAEAIACFDRALELSPNHALAHNNLGMALLRQARLADAAGHFQRALELDPAMAAAHNNLGVVYKQQGDLPRAVRHFERALELRPRYSEAINNLGSALLRLGKHEAAVECFQRALAAEPPSAGIHDRLGNALRMCDRLDEAVVHFERAMELDPASASPHAHLGATWHARGDIDAAIACYRRALALDPRLDFAHTAVAQALVAVGEKGAAKAHLQQAISAEPHHALAHWLLASILHGPLDGPTVEKLEQLLSEGGRPEHDRCWLHFALAQSYDKGGAYERALGHARGANELRRHQLQRQGRQFDRAAHVAYVDQIIAFYTPEFFAAARALGTASELPVFIVGMPRSGTTLVEQILASHSQVFGAGELDDMDRIRPGARELFGAGMRRAAQWTEGETDGARGIAQAHLHRLARLGGPAARVVDKMPSNSLHVGMIAALFPQARVIHCVREPRDVLLSCYLQNFSSEGMSFTFDWDDLTDYWRQYERLMDHWRAVLPRPMHEVSYEQLVREQESVSRGLIDFCGLAWEPRCLDFHQTPRTVSTASASQVREPIFTQSVARWRNYEPHLDALTNLPPLVQ